MINYCTKDYFHSGVCKSLCFLAPICRISFQNAELASLLWDRIKNHLEDIIINGDPKELHIEGPPALMHGHWQPAGLNSVSRSTDEHPRLKIKLIL